jgi:hypothetical protein
MGKSRTSFKPGQSGNPKGPPKKEETISNILDHYLNQVPEGDKKTRWEQIAEHTYKNAIKGDTAMLKYLWDRKLGRPKETIDANVDGNIEVIIKKF